MFAIALQQPARVRQIRAVEEADIYMRFECIDVAEGRIAQAGRGAAGMQELPHLVAALPHKPWELAWRGRFDSKIGDSKQNTVAWNSHIERARDDLNELIEMTIIEKGESPDIETARNALADDNAPAVLRALARIEADYIGVEVEEFSPDGISLKFEDDDIPFSDLSSEEE